MAIDPAFRGPIAIDGPAASGKTTVGQALAKELGFSFLDTGLMYRAFTLAALRAGVPATDAGACGALVRGLGLTVEPGPETRIILAGEDVTGRLRDPEVEANVSPYSAIPAVREEMVARQRQLAAGGRIVLAGRDIGTVVLPAAPLKLYLTASEEERARRRGEETSRAAESALADIASRDTLDSNRATSPLRAADDAVQIETTDLTVEAVVAKALAALPQAPPVASAAEQPPPRASTPAWRMLQGRVTGRLRWGTFVPPFYWACTYLLRAILVVVARWKAPGRENVPESGALIVVSNHLGNADPPIIGAAIASRRVRWMAKIELFHGVFGVLCRLWGAFPVRRFEADVAAMLNAERILKRGEVLGMFPEGTRSRDGLMGRPHPGTALIALRSGATVLPCAVSGTEVLKHPKLLMRKPRVTVSIGQPILVEKVRRPSEQQVTELTERIYAAIQALLPAEYLAPRPATETDAHESTPGGA
jgi:cytidylate kinase